MRKNLFKISQSEKNRIKNLHESVKNKPQIDGSLNYANTMITEAGSGGCSQQSMQVSCAQGHGWAGAPTCKCVKCKICCQSGTDGSNYQMHNPITVGVGRDNPGTCACPEGSAEVPCGGGDGSHGQKHCQCCIDGQPHSMQQTVPTNTPCSSLEGGNVTNCDTHQMDGGPRTISCEGNGKTDQCQCCKNGNAKSMLFQPPAGTCGTHNFGSAYSNCQKSPSGSGIIGCNGNSRNMVNCCNCCEETQQMFPGGCPDDECWQKAIGGSCSEPCGKGFTGPKPLDESSRAKSYGEVIYELPARYGRKRMTESQLVRMVKQVSRRR